MTEKNLRSFREVLAYRFNLDEDKAKEEEIIASIKKNVEFRGTNVWTLIFAILIASIGLNINSPAVIIGAMLISPLMGPVTGIGLGAGILDFKLIKFSLKNLFIAALISMMTSACYFWISPIHTAQSELLACTKPTLWDVLIAFFGGMAGIIASSRKNITNAIPGVAIATALMPPLCTAGYGIGTGNFYYFAGAFYMFLINSVFISISTFLMVRFLKFKPAHFVDDATEHKVRKYITTIALLTILPSFYLAYRFVQEEIFRQNVERFISGEVESKGLYTISRKTDPQQNKVVLLLYGETINDSLIKQIETRKALYGLEHAEVELESTLNGNMVPDKTVASAETEKYIRLMVEKDNRIRALESRTARPGFYDSTFKAEFSALFGSVKELSFSKTLIHTDSSHTDTVLLVYIKPGKRLAHTARIKAWLSARYKNGKVRLMID